MDPPSPLLCGEQRQPTRAQFCHAGAKQAFPRKPRQYRRRIKSKTEIINEALRIYLLDQELQEIRARMVPYAQAKGIYTDEDVERFLK